MKHCHRLVAGALLLAATACATAPAVESAAPWTVRAWQTEISSPQFESHPAFDAAGTRLYFVRSSPAFEGWKILESACHRGHWSEPAEVVFAGKGVAADPFLTRDGLALFFISSRKDDGITGNGLDIWRVSRATPAAAWGRPERLPAPINSAGSEWFPRLARDGWLYFGSDRPGGLGATDIYRARHRGGRWEIENLGPGVNTKGDEYEAEISPDGRRMVLMADGDLFSVSLRKGRWGGRTKLGAEINTPGLEVGPLFSLTGRSFLFARDFGTATLPLGGSGELMLATLGETEWPDDFCR